MAVTSPRQVTSGYFRNHLYVLLGFFSLAALVAFDASSRLVFGVVMAAAVLSYVGSVLWLYECRRVGIAALTLIACLSLAAAFLAESSEVGSTPAVAVYRTLDTITGGLVLGLPLAAMLLGHWYLNTPTMQLGPLRRLVLWIAVALVVRAAFSLVGIVFESPPSGSIDPWQPWFLALRWSSGIGLPLVLTWMTWKTLDIPNTQSATGILYVVVITTFTGELMALLLSGSAVNFV